MEDEVVQPTIIKAPRRVEDLTPEQLKKYNEVTHRLQSDKSISPEQMQRYEEFCLNLVCQPLLLMLDKVKPLSGAQQRAVYAAQDQFYGSFRLYFYRLFHCFAHELEPDVAPELLRKIQINMIELAYDMPYPLADAVSGWIHDQLECDPTKCNCISHCDHTKCNCMSQMYPYFWTLMEREWPPRL